MSAFNFKNWTKRIGSAVVLGALCVYVTAFIFARLLVLFVVEPLQILLRRTAR